jgi:hypothetical protein
MLADGFDVIRGLDRFLGYSLGQAKKDKLATLVISLA